MYLLNNYTFGMRNAFFIRSFRPVYTTTDLNANHIRHLIVYANHNFTYKFMDEFHRICKLENLMTEKLNRLSAYVLHGLLPKTQSHDEKIIKSFH